MFFFYTGHYMAAYGVKGDEARARIWNGGPQGYRKKATLKYWKKVQIALTKIQIQELREEGWDLDAQSKRDTSIVVQSLERALAAKKKMQDTAKEIVNLRRLGS